MVPLTEQSTTSFSPEEIYRYSMSPDSLKLPFMSFYQSVKFLSDGRASGLIVEQIICNAFKGKFTPSHKNASYDLTDTSGLRYESKVVTRSGVSPLPSYMKGQDRNYSEAIYAEKLKGFDYFIFVDISNLPLITFITVRTDHQILRNRSGRLVRNISLNRFRKELILEYLC